LTRLVKSPHIKSLNMVVCEGGGALRKDAHSGLLRFSVMIKKATSKRDFFI